MMGQKKKPPVHPSSTGGLSEKKGLLKQRKKELLMTDIKISKRCAFYGFYPQESRN
jgi:hypothetical protein